jgi:hypothetical protein
LLLEWPAGTHSLRWPGRLLARRGAARRGAPPHLRHKHPGSLQVKNILYLFVGGTTGVLVWKM